MHVIHEGFCDGRDTLDVVCSQLTGGSLSRTLIRGIPKYMYTRNYYFVLGSHFNRINVLKVRHKNDTDNISEFVYS